MHAYSIKYACIFILTFVKHRQKRKTKKYACIYNKNAQNYTKYTQNGAFTNGTPYILLVWRMVNGAKLFQMLFVRLQNNTLNSR